MEIEKVVKILKKETKKYDTMAESIDRDFKNPFHVLVSTILSTRTKDDVTEKASRKLFSKIKSPNDLMNMNIKSIEKIIYPVGFYKTKSRHLKKLGKILCEEFDCKVPNNRKDLMKLPGVGRKVANLVLSLSFKKDTICVDTHVHRISNRLGWVETKSPLKTEEELMKVLPKKYWRDINHILVSFGQNICKPINPRCEKCPVKKYCKYYKSIND